MNTTTLVTSPNINGNIGSCEIKSNSYSVDYWHSQTTAVNSYTGQTIAQNTIFDSSGLLWLPITLIIALFFKFLLD